MPEPVPKIAVLAGEDSGDSLGAGLIEALQERLPGAEFEGVTGTRMEAAGCRSLASIDELSLFGISEILLEIPRLLRLRHRLVRHWKNRPPDVFVGIDAPSFNLGVERRLRKAGIPTVHYVSPTAWAWREGRVRGIKKSVDLLLSIFPFELDFFRRHNVPVHFVGHPTADAIPPRRDRAAARRKLDLPQETTIVALLPGSRGSELQRLGPAFIETAAWLAQRQLGIHFAVPLANPRVRKTFEAQLAKAGEDLNIRLYDGQAREVLAAADVGLVASGTATLEALLCGCPMVVAYALSPSTYWLVYLLNLIKTERFSMPNLLAGYDLVDEFIQADVRAQIMGPALYNLLKRPHLQARQTQAFAAVHDELRCGADSNAAEAVIEVMRRGRCS